MNMYEIMPRSRVAQAIRLVSIAVWLTLLWQAVLYCQGEVGAPLLDQILAPASPPSEGGPMVMAFNYFGKIMRFIAGLGMWVAFAGITASLLGALADMVELGYERYMAAVKAQQEEERRWAQVVRGREQRRELRRKRRAAEQGGLSGTSLIIGLIIGWFLF